MDQTIYDEDYFERGLETGKGCYQSYRWMPEFTIPMAMTMIDLLDIKREHTVLDYGCAKGYLVKAFRLLYRKAWGCDISEYAINNADESIKDYCFLMSSPPYQAYSEKGDKHFDFCIAKDVFEHIPESALSSTLNIIGASKKLFAVIPLGNALGFIAPANNFDATHVTCRPMNWWIETFTKNGWEPKLATFRVDGIKDSYYKKYPEAHGFFVLNNTNL